MIGCLNCKVLLLLLFVLQSVDGFCRKFLLVACNNLLRFQALGAFALRAFVICVTIFSHCGYGLTVAVEPRHTWKYNQPFYQYLRSLPGTARSLYEQ